RLLFRYRSASATHVYHVLVALVRIINRATRVCGHGNVAHGRLCHDLHRNHEYRLLASPVGTDEGRTASHEKRAPGVYRELNAGSSYDAPDGRILKKIIALRVAIALRQRRGNAQQGEGHQEHKYFFCHFFLSFALAWTD